MGAISKSRANKAWNERKTASERAAATEYGGMDNGSNPTSADRRPINAAEMCREMYRTRDGTPPAVETRQERARRSQATGLGR